MQDASDDDNSSDYETIPTDVDASSFSSDDSSDQEDKDCICGGDNSDSDWKAIKCEESKRSKLEVNKFFTESPHEQLHRAIRIHDCKKIRQLLEDGFQPCTQNDNYCSNCFVLAVRSKFILKKLLEIKPSGINCQDADGYTMLMLAVKINEEIFHFLCKYNPDLSLMNDDGHNILHYVLIRCLHNNAPVIKRILDLGIDVNVADRSGRTALALAIRSGSNVNIIEMLLDRGATLTPQDENGMTIVMTAIYSGNLRFNDQIEVLKLILIRGADVGSKDNNGENAMYHMCAMFIPRALDSLYGDDGITRVTEIIIMLLDGNCEVQGLDRTSRKREYIYTHEIIVRYDVISRIIRESRNIDLLKELLTRGLYSTTNSNPDVLSPLSACLVPLILATHVGPEVGRKIIELAKELIFLGMDVSQRIWHGLICPGYTKPVEYKHRTRAEYQAAVAKELDIPDALFFAANMRIPYSDDESKEDKIKKINVAVEELLRLLLPFWPHPPLLLMLLRVDPVWSPALITTSGLDSSSETGMHFMMKVLAKIGGPLPLGTRYYTILKSALQRMAERNDLWKPMLLSLLSEPDGGIPSLRNMCRTAVRATVKKTCLTGLNFSEYRVLCEGQMVPLPVKIVNFLEFRG